MTARHIGPTLVLTAVVVGITLGERAGPSPATGALWVAATSVVLAIVTRGSLGIVLLCVGATAAGFAFACRAVDGLVHSPLTPVIERRDEATIDATLAGDPQPGRFSSTALVRTHRVRLEHGRVLEAGDRTVVIAAVDAAARRLGVLAAGDRVRLRGYFRPLDEYERRWRWRHAVGAFAATDLVQFRGANSPLLVVANTLRTRVLAGHRGISEPERALLAGFLLGDTTDVPERVVDDFRAAGLTHLVAVSGENVAFVLALVGPLLRRLPQWGRFTAGVAVLVVFGAMTRWEPSVLRACAMAGCSMLSLSLGRPTAGLRALMLAMIGLLVADPFLLHSVGFQLSCAASAGIALVGPRVAARVPGPRWFRESIGVTIGAQLAVAPILAAVFGAVPLVAVPANLAAAPLVGPLTTSGVLGGLVGGVGGGPVASIATFPAYVLTAAVVTIARAAATFPVLVSARTIAVVFLAGVVAFACRSGRRATLRRARSVRTRARVAIPPR